VPAERRRKGSRKGLSRAAAALDARTARRLRAELVALFAARGAQADLAEDLAQETLLHLLRARPHPPAGRLGAQARRAAAAVWREHLRRRRASPLELAARGDRSSMAALIEALRPAVSPPLPEDALHRQATQALLLAAVRKLPPAARRILLMHDFEDVPLTQAALLLGYSPGAAKIVLHRARRRLAELCGREPPPGPGTPPDRGARARGSRRIG
jgi:RNA polymerase sigma-70 factor (ECF subfamily)